MLFYVHLLKVYCGPPHVWYIANARFRNFLNICNVFIPMYNAFFHKVPASVRKFGCPCARDNQKRRRTTKNTDVVVRRTTINFYAPAVKLDPIYLVPSTDNQKLGRTTRNCNLVVRGTTIYFSLIRTLPIIM